MTAGQLQRLLRKRPYRPIRITLYDNRQIDIHHPQQILVTMRTFFIAIWSQPQGTPRLATPSHSDDLADDIIIVSSRQVIDAETVNGAECSL